MWRKPKDKYLLVLRQVENITEQSQVCFHMILVWSMFSHTRPRPLLPHCWQFGLKLLQLGIEQKHSVHI